MNEVELRKLQMTGGASYTVSLPKDWVKEQGLKAGDVVAVMPRSDSSLTLMPHEKLPAGQSKGAEVTVTPQRDQDREQVLRTILAQYLAGYDIIRVSFPASSKPDLRTFLRESARKMFVGSEIIEESKDELIVQCLSSYGDLPAPKSHLAHESDCEADAQRRCRLFERPGSSYGGGDCSSGRGG